VEQESIHILSFGGGIQTAYMILKNPERYDFCVFSDVSKGTRFDEKKQTYWWIDNIIKPFCEKNGVEFVTVYPKAPLWFHCVIEKIIPNTQFRWCTKRFKIEPIRKFVRECLGATKKQPVIQDIGFSYDEFWRTDGQKQDVKYLKTEFPLVDKKITRDDCKKFIMEKIGFLPPKSGCVYCPFASKAEFARVSYDEKEKVPQIIFMEHNNKRYKNKLGKIINTLKVKYVKVPGKKKKQLVGIPIEKFLHPESTSLDDYTVTEGCVTGYCHH